MLGVLADPELERFTGGRPPDRVALADRYRGQVAGTSQRVAARLESAASGAVDDGGEEIWVRAVDHGPVDRQPSPPGGAVD